MEASNLEKLAANLICDRPLLYAYLGQILSFFLSTKENEAKLAKKFYLKNGCIVLN